MANVAPLSYMLNGIANSNLAWWKAIAELIDNAFQFNAKRVTIEIRGRNLRVIDDGRGVKNVLSLATFGDHNPDGTSGLSAFGVGAKDAWLSMSDSMHVSTVYRGRKTEISFDKNELARRHWECDDPITFDTSESSGTTLSFVIKNGKNTPSRDVWDELSWRFTPALESGLQIVRDANGKSALQPHKLPVLEDCVEAEFAVDGKPVRIRIGIIPESARLYKGPFWLIFGNRIIEETSIGVGQYSVQRLGGTIHLGDAWRSKLAKNKDKVIDSFNRLEDEIFSRIEWVLKKSESICETVESAELKHQLEDQINSVISELNKEGKKARRPGTIGAKGACKPTGGGSKHRQASYIQNSPGNIEAKESPVGRKTGYKIDWKPMDSMTIGDFQPSGCRVFLNTEHPFIQLLRRDRNVHGLRAICCSLIAEYDCRRDDKGNSLFKFQYKDFGSALGRIVPCPEKEQQDARNAG